MKKVLLIGVITLLLSGCDIVIDFNTSNNFTSNKVSSSSKITGSNQNKGLTGREYLDYYSEVVNCEYFPSIGSPTMLVVPVLFSDTNEDDMLKNKDAVITDLEKAFGGTSEDTGWESVTTYYKKSSYGKLDIQMDVYDEWITLDKTFSEFASLNEYLDPTWYVVDYVVEYLKKQGVDMTQYDSDRDGFVDGIWLVYGERSYVNIPNPTTKQKDLLWAYTYWETRNHPVIGNPKANAYCWGSYDFMYGVYDKESPLTLQAHTFIHETGHILGLEDYYDYDGNSKLKPTGCLDMMDYNVGDHNAYTKYLLGWIEPQVFNFEEGQYTLNPFESSGDALLIPSKQDNNISPLDEYLLIEYYTPTGLNELDSKYRLSAGHPLMFTQKGIKIYHVDSRIGELVYDQGKWQYNGYVDNYSRSDLYLNSTGYSYFKTYASNTSSISYNRDYKLVRLLSQFYGNEYLYSGKYATNKDLFQAGESLEYFEFNSGVELNFEIEVDYIGENSKLYIF